jgi:hypothetical protein
MPNLYNTAEAAEQLGISIQRVKKLCIEIGCYKTRRDWVLTAADLRKLQRRKTAPGPAKRQEK